MKKAKKTLVVMLAVIMTLSCIVCSAFAEEREVHLAIQPSAAFVPLVIARESGWIDEAILKKPSRINIRIIFLHVILSFYSFLYQLIICHLSLSSHENLV